MAGTIYTSEYGTLSAPRAQLDSYDAIRFSADWPSWRVSIHVTNSGALDLSEKLGTVSAEISLGGTGSNSVLAAGG